MRPVGVVLMIIGLVLGGSGGYALAGYVRSGDWVLGRSAVVNASGERVVVTSYGETSYDTETRVTATSATGDVFLGTAHPIDVADYTATVARVTVSLTPLAAPKSTSVAGPSQDPPGAAKDMDFWNSSTAGAGPQSLTFSVDAAPSQMVLIATSDGPITVRVDYHIAGIRNIVIGVLAGAGALFLVGLLLLVVGIVRSGRRRRTPPGDTPFVVPAPHVPAPPVGPSWLTRWAAGGLALTLLVSAGGCTLPRVPAHVAAEPPAGKAPLTMAQARIVEEDLHNRLLVANVAGFSTEFSVDAWKSVYTAPAIDEKTFETTYAQADQETTSGPKCSLRINDVYGSVADNYPMTATVLTDWQCSGSDVTGKYFLVLTRDHSYSHWLISANAKMNDWLPPVSAEGAVTSAEQDAGRATAKGLINYINTGKSGDMVPSSSLKEFYAKSTTNDEAATDTIRAGIPDTPNAIQVAKTAKGTITTVSFASAVASVAKKGYVIYWPKPLDQVLKQPGERFVLAKRYACFATILVEEGKTYVVGWDAGLVLI